MVTALRRGDGAKDLGRRRVGAVEAGDGQAVDLGERGDADEAGAARIVIIDLNGLVRERVGFRMGRPGREAELAGGGADRLTRRRASAARHRHGARGSV